MAINLANIDETQFVIKNKKVLYPNVEQEGLILYYDAKGKKNTDTHKEKMLDLSNNGKHANLTNFAFDKGSGYSDGLVFDGVDDILTRPTLVGLTPTSMTYQLNSNILSYDKDGIVRRVQDGRVVERKGVNLIKNGNFWNGVNGWGTSVMIKDIMANSATLRVTRDKTVSSGTYGAFQRIDSEGLKYISAEFRSPRLNNGHVRLGDTTVTDVLNDDNKWHKIEIVTTDNDTIRFYATTDAEGYYELRNAQLINLTATFGAGNEPTLEQIQAEPEKWAWTPNPMDLIEATELKGNILGDVEGIIDDLNKTPILSGNPIYTDKADDAVVHVGVDGKSEQNAGSGKNLLHASKLPLDVGKTTWTAWDTWFIGNRALLSDFPEIVAGDKLTLSVWIDSTNRDVRVFVQFLNSSSQFTQFSGNLISAGSSGWSVLTFDVPSQVSGLAARDINIALRNSSNDTATVDYKYAQLEKNPTRTNWEPPAPTPDYPIAINSLDKSFDIVSSVGGRNLLLNSRTDYENVTVGIYGYYKTIDSTAFKVGDNITFSVDIKDIPLGKSLFLRLDLPNNVFSSEVISKEGRYSFTSTFTSLDGIFRYRIYPRDNAVYDIKIKNEKLEKGSTATPYSQAPEDVQPNTPTPTLYKTNILLSEPLRSVGDVKDRLFLDADGLWKIERNVGEVVLVGTERIDHSDRTTHKFFMVHVPNLNSKNSYTNKSSHYSINSNPFSVNKDNTFWVYSDSTQSNVRIQMDSFLNPSDFSDWLKKQVTLDNPVTVQYELATPAIEALSAEQQTKLNNIQSFKESNYVYTVDKIGILPVLHGVFKPADWYKENLLINSLKIYNRALSNEEMLKNYNTEKKRWGV